MFSADKGSSDYSTGLKGSGELGLGGKAVENSMGGSQSHRAGGDFKGSVVQSLW